ncbi:hypothetical protein Cflav_PD6399 [Pedosphaera parvula Ellin514]|uniref:Uncharacterized protein n=2 Tax=Pedosphaera TaxID=1032526 RepID=B9XDH8_PEDPL|nr:hypothetical protein Cflav_PD6399 [Pedosphaera parvula Ellin514]
MTDGQPCARLIANGVILLHYHNIFDSGDGLAAYVGEVTVQELGMDESGLVLSQLGYGFRGSGMERHSMLIHIEGGEVAVDIVCSEYHLIGHASNG